MDKTTTNYFYIKVTDENFCFDIIDGYTKKLKNVEGSTFGDIVEFIAGFASGDASTIVSQFSWITGTTSAKRRAYLESEIAVFNEVAKKLHNGAKCVTVKVSQTGTYDTRAHCYYYTPNTTKIFKTEY